MSFCCLVLSWLITVILAPHNPLSRETVVLAFYLNEFIKSGHAYSDNITEETRQLIQEVCVGNFRPASLKGKSKKDKTGDSSATGTRSRTRSQSVEPPLFPRDWAIDRAALRASLETFEADTRVLRQGPPSTGNTPPVSRSNTPPITSSSIGESTRATSAEEAIFGYPIGPKNMASGNRSAGMRSQSPAPDEEWRDSGFDERQWAALRRLMSRPPGGPGPGPDPPAAGNENVAASNYARPWNAKELGFFDDNYGGKTVHTGGAAIEHADSRAIFRDVRLFLERAKDLAASRGAVVRENLEMSLLGSAMDWWLGELSEAEKRLVKYGASDSDLSEWSRLLLDRFSTPPNVAIDAVLKERYTFRDAASQREPREYAQRILRSAKDAGMTNVRNLVDIIYNGIDLELRKDVRKPDEATTINSFLKSIDSCKHEWWEYAVRRPRNAIAERGNYYQSPRYGYARQPLGRQPYFVGQQSPYGGAGPYAQPPLQRPANAYSSQPQNYGQSGQQFQPQQQTPPALPAPRQPLQIGAPQNVSGSTPRPPFAGNQGRFQRNDRKFTGNGNRWQQGGNSRQKALVYQATAEDAEEEAQQPPGEEGAAYHAQGEEAYSYGGEDEFGNEFFYSGQDGYPDEQFAGFVGIDTSCRNCKKSFRSGNQLHKHLKDSCSKGLVVNRNSNAKTAKMQKENIVEKHSQENASTSSAPNQDLKRNALRAQDKKVDKHVGVKRSKPLTAKRDSTVSAPNAQNEKADEHVQENPSTPLTAKLDSTAIALHAHNDKVVEHVQTKPSNPLAAKLDSTATAPKTQVELTPMCGVPGAFLTTSDTRLKSGTSFAVPDTPPNTTALSGTALTVPDMLGPSTSRLTKALDTISTAMTATPSLSGGSSTPAVLSTKDTLPKSTVSPTPSSSTTSATLPDIVESNASKKDLGNGFAFRSWTYAKIPVRLLPNAEDVEVCVDSGCGVTLIDRTWMLSLIPGVKIHKMASPLKVRGLGTSKHETSEYITNPLYLPAVEKDTAREVLACIHRELHVVEDLRAKMLIGNDILGPEEIVIDVAGRKAYIGSCNSFASVTAHQRSSFLRRHVHAKTASIIPPHGELMIPTSPLKLPEDRDFLFEPSVQGNLTMYAHLVDHGMSSILVRNDSNSPVQIPKKTRLGNVTEIDYDNCFQAEVDTDYAAVPSKLLTQTPSPSIPGARPVAEPQVYTPVPGEVRCPNGVMLFGGEDAVRALAELVEEFPTLWVDNGFVRVPEEEWMRISLRQDWQTKVLGKAKIYPLGTQDRNIIDKTFDEMHVQGRLDWTKDATPFSYPVFVVWKTLPDGTKKGRAVVDIRGLNSLIVPDAYPVPLQAEIIGSLVGCSHISVLDASSFFYQWRVHPKDRHMLTVVTHRGQETFNVPVMGCMNSIAYVQRQIDKILRPVKHARAYIDDVVTGATSFQQHLKDLRELFQLFVDYNISISPTKTFLGYPDVNLLGQRVNSLGLTSSEDKLRAISKLSYPKTLGALEHYLGLTGYLRQYVHYYAQLARPLQELKTTLLKESPSIGGRPRKKYSSTKILPPPLPSELASFEELQKAMSQPSMLVHFDPSKTLWIDLDASKEFGFGAVVFHSKDFDEKDGKWPTRTTMQPILFLSRLLTPAEQNYWPTELEIAGFVWVIKKVRHMVESSKYPVRVQTDHSAILDIFRQSSIVSTTSTMRMNVRLVRASQFLRQFRLEVTHKPGKEHILPDALSRLASCSPSMLPDDHSELDALFAATLVNMNDEFYDKLVMGYQQDPFWKRVLAQVDENHALGENAVPLPFVRGEHLPPHEADPYFGPRAGVETSPVQASVARSQGEQQYMAPHTGNAAGPASASMNSNAEASRSTGEQDLIRTATQEVGAAWESREEHNLNPPGLPARPLLLSHSPHRSSPGPRVLESTEEQGLTRPGPLATPLLLPHRTQLENPGTEASEYSPQHDLVIPGLHTRPGLLFHIDRMTGLQRLCIPATLVKEILGLAHGSGHPGFQRCYAIVTSSWYIHGLVRHLRDYIRHCPECLILQTRRHAPYGSLNPISSPPVPFHTITIDFILALPLSEKDLDAAMSATDKFTKRVTFVAGKTTWSAKEWAVALLDRLDIADWGLPKVMISDRDRKFLSEFWKAIFDTLGVSLLYSTAYHPQTDGTSERTNQTAEIALRFYVHGLDKPSKWPEVLPRIQAFLNNSSASGPTPNEVAYGFTPNKPLDLLATSHPPNHFLARTTAADAISFAQMANKFHYDRKHQPMFLKVGDWALLRLHKGYSIPSTLGVTTKLAQQYVGPFKVTERVGRLAYRLAVPEDWKVHPVFTIAQLEPAPAPTDDPYDRPRPTHPQAVSADGQEYDVERLLNKRVIRKGRGLATEYLLRWKGYGPEFDRWYNVKDLQDALELVEEYEEEARRMDPSAVATPSALTSASPLVSAEPLSSALPPKRRRGRPRKPV